MSEEKNSTGEQLQLPPDFNRILIEVISPNQSIDYITVGDRLFNIQVLPIAQEKKFLRLSRQYESDTDKLLVFVTGELCHFYYPELPLDWASKNASKEQLDDFYIKHLEKLAYNDDVIGVISQVASLVRWQPIDEKRKAEYEHYKTANIFSSVLLYLNILENTSIGTIFNTMTRGCLELVKLNNMLANDKLRLHGTDVYSKENRDSKKMTEAKTMDEYMAGLSSQGFSLSSLM